ncbi:hypothetical protein [Thermococcus sp.]|uniref:hypothetical protein n=1 Tax=Thermococcus sp. TaxID=35749 RepID=UPI0026336410|nr:hypothetical protein [Thermococcus sp.]
MIVAGIPGELTVAFGGKIRGNRLEIEETNRIDIAVAPFKIIEENPSSYLSSVKRKLKERLSSSKRPTTFTPLS